MEYQFIAFESQGRTAFGLRLWCFQGHQTELLKFYIILRKTKKTNVLVDKFAFSNLITFFLNNKIHINKKMRSNIWE